MTNAYCEQCGAAQSSTGAYCEQCGTAMTATTNGTVAASMAFRPAETEIALKAAPASPAPPPPQPQGTPPSHIGASEPQAAPAALRGVSTSYGRRARSSAWIYYLLLALGNMILVFAGKPIGLLGAVLCGAYSYYIYNGGRIVIWFW